jgi:hypothetical protein
MTVLQLVDFDSRTEDYAKINIHNCFAIWNGWRNNLVLRSCVGLTCTYNDSKYPICIPGYVYNGGNNL